MQNFRPVLSHPTKTIWVFHEQLQLAGKILFPSFFLACSCATVQGPEWAEEAASSKTLAKPTPCSQIPDRRKSSTARARKTSWAGEKEALGWQHRLGWGWNLSWLFPAQRLPCSPGCWMAFCAINSFKKTKRNSGSCSRVLKIISRCSPKIPGQVRQSKCNLNAAFRQDQPADTEVRHKMLPFPCSLHQCHSSF